MNWFLRITYADVANNEFLDLDGALCRGKAQRDAVLLDIPVGPDDSPYILVVR